MAGLPERLKAAVDAIVPLGDGTISNEHSARVYSRTCYHLLALPIRRDSPNAKSAVYFQALTCPNADSPGMPGIDHRRLGGGKPPPPNGPCYRWFSMLAVDAPVGGSMINSDNDPISLRRSIRPPLVV